MTSLAFVENIQFDATAKDIGDYFNSKFGAIKDASIVAEYKNGEYYSRGIGLVEFNDKRSLQNALAKQNTEFKLQGSSETRLLNITQARGNNKYDTAVIDRIPKNSDEKDIINAFKIKKPIKIKIKNERICSYAYAKFASPNDLNIAFQYNEKIILGNSECCVSMTQINFHDL